MRSKEAAAVFGPFFTQLGSLFGAPAAETDKEKLETAEKLEMVEKSATAESAEFAKPDYVRIVISLRRFAGNISIHLCLLKNAMKRLAFCK